MNNYLDCKNIETSIRRAKNVLIEKEKKTGLYENFGQTEVRRIKEKFIDTSDYSSEMNKRRLTLDCFDSWCRKYTGDKK